MTAKPGADKKPGCAARLLLWFFLCVVVPLGFLAAAEGVLRLAAVGETTRLTRETEFGGRRFHALNPAFYQQFSQVPIESFLNWDDMEFQVADEKPGNAFRIFVFGGSAMYGAFSAPRILEVMLEAAYPGIAFEVHNAACPGMNSHVMAAAAADCVALRPDCYVIYMGNNELVGPYGPQTRIARYPLLWRVPVIRALIWMNDLRLVQAVRGPGAGLAEKPDAEELRGQEPRQTSEERPNAHYRANLGAMCDGARGAGAETVVCTLAHNWRFGRPDVPLPPGDPNNLVRTVTNESVLRIVEARDGVRLADTERALVQASPEYVPGYDCFVDNIHFTFHGSYVAARAVFGQISEILRERGLAQGIAPAPAEDDCAMRLAWTPATEAELLRMQVNVVYDPPSRERLEKRLAELEAALGDDERAAWRAGFERAIEVRPHDRRLRRRFAEGLLRDGDAETALAQAQVLVERAPQARSSFRTLAQALLALGRADEARAALDQLLGIYPGDPIAKHMRESLGAEPAAAP